MGPQSQSVSKADALAEAYKRGLLPPEKKAAYEEAQRRGLLKPAAPSDRTAPPLDYSLNLDPNAAKNWYNGAENRDGPGAQIPSWRTAPATDPAKPAPPPPLWEAPVNVAKALVSPDEARARALVERRIDGVGPRTPDMTRAPISEQQLNSQNYWNAEKPPEPMTNPIKRAARNATNVLSETVNMGLEAFDYGRGALEPGPRIPMLDVPTAQNAEQAIADGVGIIGGLALPLTGPAKLFQAGGQALRSTNTIGRAAAAITPQGVSAFDKATRLAGRTVAMVPEAAATAFGAGAILGGENMGGDGDRLQSGVEFASDPINYIAQPAAMLLNRAGIFIKSAGQRVTPEVVQVQRAQEVLRRANATAAEQAAAARVIEELTPPLPAGAAQQAPTQPQAGSAVDDVDRARFESWADKATFTELYRALDNAAEIEAKGGLPDDIAYAKARAEAAQRAIDAENAKRVAEGLAPRVRTAQQAPQPSVAPVVSPNVAQGAAGAAQPGPAGAGQQATAGAGAAQPVPAPFSAPAEPAGGGFVRRNADRFVGGAVGATIGGAGDAYAAPGDGNGEGNGGPLNAGTGAFLGAFGPRMVASSASRGFRAMARPFRPAGMDERVAARAVRNALKAGGITNADEASAAFTSRFGDKPASIADLTQEGVSTAAGLSRRAGATGEAARARGEELLQNRAGRLERDIGQANPNLNPATITGDVERMVALSQEQATPAYSALREGYPLGSLTSPRLEQLSQIDSMAPHIKAVNDYRATTAATEGRVVGDFEYWDLVKRDIDAKEQQLIAAGATMDDIRLRKLEDTRNALVQELDTLVPDYPAARQLGGEAPKMREAMRQGQRILGQYQTAEEVARLVAGITGQPQLTALQAGVIRSMVQKTEGATGAMASLMSAGSRRKLSEVFGPEAAEALQARFAADAAIVQNAQRINPNIGSVTSQAQMGEGGFLPMAAEAIRAFRSPIEATLAAMSKGGAYSKAQRDLMGQMLLEGATPENLARIFGNRGGRGGRPAPPAPQGPPTGGGAGPARGPTVPPAPTGPAPRARPAPSQEAVLSAMAQVTQPAKGRPMVGPPTRDTIWDGPVPTKPQSLRGWIRSQGGINDRNYMTGDMKAVMGRASGMPGLINRESGSGLDELARKAYQEGFDVDPEDAGTLMRLLEEEFAGSPSYRIGAKEEWEAYQDTLRARRGDLPGQQSNSPPMIGGAALGALTSGGATYAATGDEEQALKAGILGGIGGGVVGSRFGKGSTPKAPPAVKPKPAFDQRFMSEAQRLVSYNGGVDKALKAQQYVIDQLKNSKAPNAQDRLNRAVSIQYAIRRMAERSNRELDEIAATAWKRDPATVGLGTQDYLAYINAKHPPATPNQTPPYFIAASTLKRAGGDRQAAAAELADYAAYLRQSKAAPEVIENADRAAKAVADVDPMFFDDAAFNARMRSEITAGGEAAVAPARGAADALPGERRPRSGPPGVKPPPVKMGFGGSPRTEERGPMFYSALSRAVEKSPTTKAPAAQWKATIANSPGVKAEEIEWTGVNDWLDMQTGPVTKQQVAEYLDGNGVKIDEVVKGGNRAPSGKQLSVEETADEDGIDAWAAVDEDGNVKRYFDNEDDARDFVDIENEDLAKANQTEWDQHTLPGGDDYTELLLTLPKIKGPSTHWGEPNVLAHARFKTRYVDVPVTPDKQRKVALNDRIKKEYAAARDDVWRLNNEIRQRQPLDQSDPLWAERRAAGDKLSELEQMFNKSSLLAMPERRKVLAIEEIQSDWHQKGREQGYESAPDPAMLEQATRKFDIAEEAVIASRAAIDEVLLSLRGPPLKAVLDGIAQNNHGLAPGIDAIRAMAESGGIAALSKESQDIILKRGRDHLRRALNYFDREAGSDEVMRFNQVQRAITQHDRVTLQLNEARQQLQNAKYPSGIPNAPFKGSDKWGSLALKRMIRWAAENGFDEIAWIPGHIKNGESIADDVATAVRLRNDGVLQYRDADGDWLKHPAYTADKKAADGMSLDNVLGKRAADDLRARAADEYGDKTIEGDLKIHMNPGWEFYDQVLVNEANKLAKKHGAQVAKTKVKGGKYEVISPSGKVWHEADSEKAARGAIPKSGPLAGSEVRQIEHAFHSLPITPELKKQALGGQALMSFARGNSRGIADNLKQDAGIAALGSVGGSFANQDDPQAGAGIGMGLALGGKYVPRAVNAVRGAGRVKPPPMRGADQAGIAGRPTPPKGQKAPPKGPVKKAPPKKAEEVALINALKKARATETATRRRNVMRDNRDELNRPAEEAVMKAEQDLLEYRDRQFRQAANTARWMDRGAAVADVGKKAAVATGNQIKKTMMKNDAELLKTYAFAVGGIGATALGMRALAGPDGDDDKKNEVLPPTDKRYFVETKLKKRPEMLGPVQNALVELGMLDIIDADTKWGTKTKDALAAYLSRKPDRLPDLPLQDYEVPALLAEAYGGYQENGKWFYSTGEPIVYPPKQNDTYLPARPLRPDEARRMAYEKRTEAQRNK